MSELVIENVAAISGEIRPPSDKSITHRSIMFAGIADGPCLVHHPLRGHDPMSTLACMQALGVIADWESSTALRLSPPAQWRQPTDALDCGNSGSTMRLLAGLLASRRLDTTLVGDASLSKRPMARVAGPLREMGAQVAGDHPPLLIHGSDHLHSIQYKSSVSSAQVKSCVLLAALRADGESTYTEPNQSRDHTERMLFSMGAELRASTEADAQHSVSIKPCFQLRSFERTVPADISSAAFFMVAAQMVRQSNLTILGVGLNPSRTGILDVFRSANLAFELRNQRNEGGEPIGDIYLAKLGGGNPFQIGEEIVPRLIDEIPVLAVLATQLSGISVIRGAKELRVKESDRIDVMASGLRAMGATVETFEDGMAIEGPCDLVGTTVDAQNDHRIGMAFAIAGLAANGSTKIVGAETIATSFPNFEAELNRLSVHA